MIDAHKTEPGVSPVYGYRAGTRRGFLVCALVAVLAMSAAPVIGRAAAQVQTPSGALAPANMPPVAPSSDTALPEGRARDLSKQIMCNCGCGDTAGSCSHPGAAFSGPCEVAKGKLVEIKQRVDRGESNDSILQSFVQEYGEAVLAVPPARGFNWFAWTFPAIAFAIGLVLVIMIIRQWRNRVAMAPASGPAVSAEMLEHARREIEREVQDD